MKYCQPVLSLYGRVETQSTKAKCRNIWQIKWCFVYKLDQQLPSAFYHYVKIRFVATVI